MAKVIAAHGPDPFIEIATAHAVERVTGARAAPRERIQPGANLYTEDELEEITGRFAALSAEAAAGAAARAVARASRPDDSLPPVVRRTRRWGRATGSGTSNLTRTCEGLLGRWGLVRTGRA